MTTETVLATTPKVSHPNEVLGMGADFTDLLATVETIESVDRIIVSSSRDFPNELNDTVDAVSSSGSDTAKTLTVYGKNSHGQIISEGLSLNGTTVVSGTKTFAKVLQVKLSAACVGAVTVRKGGTSTAIETLAIGELTIPRLLIEEEDTNAVTMFDDNGDSIAVGKGVFFTKSLGEPDVDYKITVDVTTSDTNVRTGVLPLEIRDGGI